LPPTTKSRSSLRFPVADMTAHIQFLSAPIPRPVSWSPDGAAGALAEFYGIIRSEENGLPISGIEYEIYHRMAEHEIHRIVGRLTLGFPCQRVVVIHREGLVPVGEAAIYVGARARHRQAAFGFLEAFMDHLKKDVPIWKARILPC